MHMIKKTALATAVAGSLMTSSAMAGVSMNIGVTNNYLWRGVTQTSDQPAIQGGLDYNHSSGFYVGTWLSNVDWTSDNEGTQVNNVEVDLYAGYGMEFAKDWSFDVGYIYYAYPLDGSSDGTPGYDTKVEADFGEVYGALSWSWLTWSIYKQVNQEWSGDNKNDAYYTSLDGSWGLPSDFTLSALVGYYGGELAKDTFGKNYYNGYLGVSKSTDYGDVTLAVEKNNIDDDSNIDDPRFTVSWGMEF